MLQLVSKPAEINRCQGYFEGLLQQVLPERKQHLVGHQGMSYEVPIWTDGGIWFTTRIVGEPQPNRYWNAFGFLNCDSASHIVLEINIPLEGVNRKIAGMFATGNHSDDLYLLHRGAIAGGRKGIGKNAFLDWYRKQSSDRLVQVSEGDGNYTEAIHISHLPSKFLKDDLRRFIEEVRQFKHWATT